MSQSELHDAVVALERAVAARLLSGIELRDVALEGAAHAADAGLIELEKASVLPIATEPLPDPAELVSALLRIDDHASPTVIGRHRSRAPTART